MKLIGTILTILLSVSPIKNGSFNNNSNMKDSVKITDKAKQYGFNRDFLKKHTDIIELKNGASAITIAPAWQGRVMTSTSEGDKGFSFGWINRDLIANGKIAQHINAFGGEERLWLGPERLRHQRDHLQRGAESGLFLRRECRPGDV